MPLATLNIDDLVREATLVYIKKCTYEPLRTHCLDRMPLEAVVQAVDDILVKECGLDKQDSQKQLTAAAFKQQEEDDRKEADADKHGAEQDRTLQDSLLEKLNHLQGQISGREINRNSLSSQKLVLTNQIAVLNRQISALENTHHHSHHDHGHGHSSTSHHHGHTVEHHHGHGGDEVGVLTLRRNHLQEDLIVVGLGLREVEAKIRQLNSEYNEAGNELNQYMPRRASERQQRAMARQWRADERVKGTLDQLSEKKRKGLENDILFLQNKLQDKKEGLLNKVKENSYSSYITLLLHGASLEFLGQSSETLLGIAATMNSYLEEKKKENQERLNLKQAKLLRDAIAAESEKAQTRLKILQEANPLLMVQNNQLEQENSNLLAEINRRQQGRQRLLLASLFAFLSVAIGVGVPLTLPLLTTLSMTASLLPLLFVPGGAAAVVLVGLLITALVFTLMNNACENQIQQNRDQIIKNQQTVKNQTEEMTGLEENKIPELKDKLQMTEVDIRRIASQLDSHVMGAQFFYSKAGQIQASSVANQEGFFAVPPVPVPSAPPMENPESLFLAST